MDFRSTLLPGVCVWGFPSQSRRLSLLFPASAVTHPQDRWVPHSQDRWVPHCTLQGAACWSPFLQPPRGFSAILDLAWVTVISRLGVCSGDRRPGQAMSCPLCTWVLNIQCQRSAAPPGRTQLRGHRRTEKRGRCPQERREERRGEEGRGGKERQGTLLWLTTLVPLCRTPGCNITERLSVYQKAEGACCWLFSVSEDSVGSNEGERTVRLVCD